MNAAPRVLILGNTAQNGWLLATFLREYAGADTHLVHQGHRNQVYAPWWEEGGDPAWACPDWATTFQGATDEAQLADLGARARTADVVVLVAAHVELGPALARLAPDVPSVVFDCSLLRELDGTSGTGAPDDPHHALAARGYVGAAHVVLTNADTQPAAQRLAPGRYSFIPHPVNTALFAPTARLRDEGALRAGLLEGAELLFFSPTRHDEDVKATSCTVQAFAAYDAQVRAGNAPPARLILVAHGQGALAMGALCDSLGLPERVGWLPTLTKWQLGALYRAADVVLDQFSPSVGAFGTIAVETLACGRPLITHLDPSAHTWCADVLPVPPVCLAADDLDAARWLTELAGSPGQRTRLGVAGRAWVERWQTPERVAGLWLDVCQRVLAPLTKEPLTKEEL